jgi:poly-gamma-glutamate synthesis protein (capsule biosynthesis protein)
MTGLGHFIATIVSAIAALFHFSVPPLPPLPIPLLQVSKQATVLFGGDMMFDRSIRTTIDEKGGDFVFSCIDGTLKSADLVVANLEGPITGNPSKSVGSKIGAPDNFTFTFPTSTAPLLATHHIGIVSLGNNHILNFGTGGVRSTIDALTESGVGYFGQPRLASGEAGDPLAQRVATTTIHGVALAFINYNEFESASTASLTIKQIKAARSAGEIPVVYAHWGVEYATTSPQYVQRFAHRFIDAGAAIVIGSHPHVVEQHEVYKGVHIYYSLGNFIFDQYWNDAVRRGLLLRVIFTPAGVSSVTEIPVELGQDRRTCAVK